MKRFYPQFRALKRGQFDIEFTGKLIISLVLPIYTISINYRGNLRPLVRILKPVLVEDPPHFHKENTSLCLYHQRNYHWVKEKLIAKDIVSWAAAWIYFYEKWLQTGKWYGPEVPHEENLVNKENY